MQWLDVLRRRAPAQVGFLVVAINVDSGYAAYKHDVLARTGEERSWEYSGLWRSRPEAVEGQAMGGGLVASDCTETHGLDSLRPSESPRPGAASPRRGVRFHGYGGPAPPGGELERNSCVQKAPTGWIGVRRCLVVVA